MEDMMNEKPLEQEMLPKLVQEFLRENAYPSQKPARPQLLVIFGPPGAGKTELARRLVKLISGMAHVQANGVRHLLRHVEGRTYRWGQNVRDIVREVAKSYLASGYGVVLDGSGTDKEDRENVERIAREAGAKLFFVHIMADLDTMVSRERDKYERAWRENIDTFHDCRINTTEKMAQNTRDRHAVHQQLKMSEVPSLLTEVNNNGHVQELDRAADDIVAKLNTV